MWGVCVSLATFLTGCFTGIESTKKIELSRGDMKMTAPSPEKLYLDSILAAPLGQWDIGKRFLATDDRSSLMFLPRSLPHDTVKLGGKVLCYEGTETTLRPDGTEGLLLRLAADGHTYLYDTGKTPADARETFTSDVMETFVDLDLVAALDHLMEGQTLYTRTPVWYDPQEKLMTGRKFVPVTVDSVTPGTLVFPVRVWFTDPERNVSAHMLMSLPRHTGAASRRFQSLFLLSDLKKRYPDIDNEVWRLIQEGKVRQGMTKEECRLSLGEPADAYSGHNYAVRLDTWTYDGGRFLQFEDGLLVNFRI